MRGNRLFVTTCVLFLTGCALPIEPEYNRKVLAAKGQMGPMPSVKDVRNIADAWTSDLETAVRDRHMQDLVASEVFFYGTLLFTAGSSQLARRASEGWKRVRNVGAAGAAGSELLRSHYQPENQSLAFKQAATLMKCMTESLQQIPAEDEYLNLFDQADKAAINGALTVDPKDIDALYNAVPRQSLHFMEQVVLPKLQTDLKAITLGTPTKEELAATFDKYKTDKSSGDAGAKAVAPSPTTHAKMKAFLANTSLDQEAVKLRQKAVVSALASYASGLLLCKPAS